MGEKPKPTQEEFDELKAEVADLCEEVAAIAGALNALDVVWQTHLLGKRVSNEADTSEVQARGEDR